MDGDAPRFFLPDCTREVASRSALAGAEPLLTNPNARAASSPNAADVGGTRAGEAGAHHPGPGLLLHEIPATAGDPGRVGHAHRETGVSSQNSPAGNGVAAGHDVVPTTPAGAFSGAAISTLAKGLTELSGALLTIARALHSLAPHPTSGRGNGPSVSTGPRTAARGESTGTPKRGAEPRRHSTGRPVAWNAARLAHLKERWAAGDSPEALFAALNAIPGDAPIGGPHAVRVQAQKHGWQRSAEGLRRGRERAAQKNTKPAKWTDAMGDVVRMRYPDKAIPIEDIAATLTELAGQPISVDAVRGWAQKHHIIRPKGRVADRPYGGKRKLHRWSDQRRQLLAALWVQQPRLTQSQIAEELNKLPGEPVTPHQVGVYALSAMHLPPRGLLPRVDGNPEIPRDEPTNPAREMAVSAGPLPRPTAQSSAAAGGAPRPTMLLGHNGARIDLPAVAKPDGEPPPYDPTSKGSVEARTARAKVLLRAGKDETYVQMQTRIGLREVMRLVGEIRRERAA